MPHRIASTLPVVVLAVLPTVAAADPFADHYDAARAANPPDIRFEVRTADAQTTFRQGELIPLELVFSSTSAERYQLDEALYDRSGRLHSDTFHVDPADGTVDPLRAYFSRGLWGLGGLRTMSTLDVEPTSVEVVLNEWLRFDRPGPYRLWVETSRVDDLDADRLPGHGPPMVPVVSDVFEIEIVDADPVWQTRAFERATREIASEDDDVARRGCSRLRHLGTDAALDALVRMLGNDDHSCRGSGTARLGLFGHPDQRLVVERLEAQLLGPGAVGSALIDTLARLKWFSEHPLPAHEEEDQEERSDRLLTQDRGVEQLQRLYLARLANAVDEKSGPALAATLATLVTSDASGSADLLVPHFHELSGGQQLNLLRHRWDDLRGPAMVPVLLRVIDDPPDVDWIGGPQPLDWAVRRLFDLDPEAATEIVLTDLLRPNPRLHRETLGHLPDLRLSPEVEGAILDRLEGTHPADRRDGVGELAHALARYGSPDALERVVAIYESDRFQGLSTCWRAPFLAYFLRVDPPAGEERLRRALELPEPGEYSACRKKRLKTTASLHTGPGLQGAAIALLDSPDVELRKAAAEVLRERGSAAAEAPLWARLDRFSVEWRPRAAELEAPRSGEDLHADERAFEWELVRALSQAEGWALGRADLERLLSLAVGATARDQTEMRLRWASGDGGVPLTVFAGDPPTFDVAGYRSESVEALERRLAQFDDGTVFVTSIDSRTDEDRRGLLLRLESFLAERGMGLVIRQRGEPPGP